MIVTTHPLRLGVNIDHVATLRNARGGVHPCPVEAAKQAIAAGADGITAHLREDRRHIRDADITQLAALPAPLNFEMAATPEMQNIALQVRPNAVCIVPEKREELTTEGGLNVCAQMEHLRAYIQPFKQASIRVSLFVDANTAQLDAAAALGADIVELHTGSYCHTPTASNLHALTHAAAYAERLGLECHAGHGLCYQTVGAVAAITQMQELNIGHFIIAQSVFDGLESVIHTMRYHMIQARV